jgi:hypothetical protein
LAKSMAVDMLAEEAVLKDAMWRKEHGRGE